MVFRGSPPHSELQLSSLEETRAWPDPPFLRKKSVGEPAYDGKKLIWPKMKFYLFFRFIYHHLVSLVRM